MVKLQIFSIENRSKEEYRQEKAIKDKDQPFMRPQAQMKILEISGFKRR